MTSEDRLRTLSEEEFRSSMEEFVKRSRDIGDTWELNDVGGNVYARKTLVVAEEKGPDPDELDSGSLGSGGSFTSFEYHVIYSPSYQVPVLYIRAYDRSGQLLMADQVIRTLASSPSVDPWQTLTQQGGLIFVQEFCNFSFEDVHLILSVMLAIKSFAFVQNTRTFFHFLTLCC